MKYKVFTFSATALVSERPVNWIKEFRDQTGCGLKEAKDVCDWLRGELADRRAKFLVLDTDVEPNFRFLDSNVMISLGAADLIQRFDVKSKPKLTRPTATVVLERAAARLIKLGDYSKARDVLKILI
ncbi:hypothetical protein D3C76_77670 [compost metagenome]